MIPCLAEFAFSWLKFLKTGRSGEFLTSERAIVVVVGYKLRLSLNLEARKATTATSVFVGFKYEQGLRFLRKPAKLANVFLACCVFSNIQSSSRPVIQLSRPSGDPVKESTIFRLVAKLRQPDSHQRARQSQIERDSVATVKQSAAGTQN